MSPADDPRTAGSADGNADSDGDRDYERLATDAENRIEPPSPPDPAERLTERFTEPDVEDLEPDTTELDFSEVDGDLVRTFVASVLLTNFGVLAVSLGVMLAYFRGQTTLAGVLVAIGVLALVRTYQHYREFQRSRGDGNA